MKKNYTVINIVFLLFAVYMLLLPKITPFMRAHFPNLWRCAYLNITGEPCPFCGVTTDIKALNTGKFKLQTTKNPVSVIVYSVLWFEVALRSLLIVLLRYIRKMKFMISFDIVVHTILFSYFIYWIVVKTVI